MAGPCGTASAQYDSGAAGVSVGFSARIVVAVHMTSQGALWHRVGSLDVGAATVNWGDSQRYDNGSYPSVALAEYTSGGFDSGTFASGTLAVEVHQGDSPALWYRVGIVAADSKTIAWGDSRQYDNGSRPAIALVGAVAVEVHESEGALWYRAGVVSADSKTIDWGEGHQYDSGHRPAVATDGTTVYEVHQGSAGVGALWSRMGPLDQNARTVGWGAAQQYDNGLNPSIAAVGDGFVTEVHQAVEGVGPLWSRSGQAQGGQLQWSGSSQYDNGALPSIAMGWAGGASSACVEVHLGDLSSGSLFYRAYGGDPLPPPR